MKLESFIAATINEVISGVALAQQRPDGDTAVVNPTLGHLGGMEGVVIGVRGRRVETVEFEVPVRVVDAEGIVGVLVADQGTENGTIRFTVPITFQE